MGYYYFIISSLPHLSYGMSDFPSLEDFLGICRENIAKKDFEVLVSANIFKIEYDDFSNEVLKKWYSWESNFRNQLAFLRAVKKQEDPGTYIHISLDELEVGIISNEAFKEESPLIAEDIINRARWSFLEDMEFSHYFDFEKLIIYYLKLQVLSRIKTFDKDKGTEKLSRMIKKFSDSLFFEIQKQNEKRE